MLELSREELQNIRDTAIDLSGYVVECHKRAYIALADAADRLDAMKARTTVRAELDAMKARTIVRAGIV